MGKLLHLPFDKSPRYPLMVEDNVRAWFSQVDNDGTRRVVEALMAKQRLPGGQPLIRPGEAFRLIVQYRRDDIWAAVCAADPNNQRRDWTLGHAFEQTWNHEFEAFAWFAALPQGARFLSNMDVVVAMAQGQDFCTSSGEFVQRQRVVSQLAMYRPDAVRWNPHMWSYLVEPTLALMQLCSYHNGQLPFEKHHFDHLREGSYQHFQMLLAAHGRLNAMLWREMRRFVEQGQAQMDPHEQEYAGALREIQNT